METELLGLTEAWDGPSSNSNGAAESELKQARKLIEQAIRLVGESDFAQIVEVAGQERLRTAVSRLMGSEWWQATIKQAMVQPQQFNTQLLCKMLDKAVPTQQAAKQGVEEGFKLLIENVVVAGAA